MSRKVHSSANVAGQSNLFDNNTAEKPSPRLSKRRRILSQACKGAYGVEPLESRVMLAADFWTGGGANANWSTGANWVSGVAPRPADDLIFPAGAAQLTNTNDFVPGTVFSSIELKAGGYVLNGNAITLSTGIVSQNPVGLANADTVNLGSITLNGNQTWGAINGSGLYSQTAIANQAATLFINSNVDLGSLLTLTVDGSGNTVLNGNVSDSGGITKTGQGILQLSGNNTYMGITQISIGVLEATTNTALAGTNTIMNNGAALWLSGNLNNITEPIVVIGSGIGLGVDANGNGGSVRVVPQNYQPQHPGHASASNVSIGTPTANVGIALQPSQNDFIGVDHGRHAHHQRRHHQHPGQQHPTQQGRRRHPGHGRLGLQYLYRHHLYPRRHPVLGGLLQLAKTNGAIAIADNIQIGDTAIPSPAIPPPARR